MKSQSVGSFLARLRQRYFEWRLSREIFDGMFTHLNNEKNIQYPFADIDEMNAQTEAMGVDVMLARIERQIGQMPESYGKCFRYLLHRELKETLASYEREARRRVQPTNTDLRFVATRA